MADQDDIVQIELHLKENLRAEFQRAKAKAEKYAAQIKPVIKVRYEYEKMRPPTQTGSSTGGGRGSDGGRRGGGGRRPPTSPEEDFFEEQRRQQQQRRQGEKEKYRQEEEHRAVRGKREREKLAGSWWSQEQKRAEKTGSRRGIPASKTGWWEQQQKKTEEQRQRRQFGERDEAAKVDEHASVREKFKNKQQRDAAKEQAHWARETKRLAKEENAAANAAAKLGKSADKSSGLLGKFFGQMSGAPTQAGGAAAGAFIAIAVLQKAKDAADATKSYIERTAAVASPNAAATEAKSKELFESSIGKRFEGAPNMWSNLYQELNKSAESKKATGEESTGDWLTKKWNAGLERVAGTKGINAIRRLEGTPGVISREGLPEPRQMGIEQYADDMQIAGLRTSENTLEAQLLRKQLENLNARLNRENPASTPGQYWQDWKQALFGDLADLF